MNEPDLIRRARGGDAAAWELLVTEHQEAAFRLAYLFLGDAAEAEDTAQEAFIRAYRALDRFDASRPWRPWLLSITANLARNRRRAIGRYWYHLRRMLRDAPQAEADVAGRYGQQARAERLRQAVGRLDDREQEIIFLRYFMELSVEETAQVLEIAPGTVKSRLYRALNRLRAVVERDFPELREELVLDE